MNLDEQHSATFIIMIALLMLVYGSVKLWRSMNG